MTRIDVDGEGDGASGVTALVVAVLEILVETMEREGLRRMESGQLSDAEIEALGERFAALNEEIEGLKDEAGVQEQVADLRGDLDGLVSDALREVQDPAASAAVEDLAGAPRGGVDDG